LEIIIYGMYEDYNAFIDLIDVIPEMQYRRINCTHTENYDDFLNRLRSEKHDMIIVTADGAEGMEGVIASHTIRPETRRIWLSNDEGFAIQAHRMNCTYFAVKPITSETISKAYRAFQKAAIS